MFGSIEDKTFACCMLLHTADISNPAKPADIYASWTKVITEEFFAQVRWAATCPHRIQRNFLPSSPASVSPDRGVGIARSASRTRPEPPNPPQAFRTHPQPHERTPSLPNAPRASRTHPKPPERTPSLPNSPQASRRHPEPSDGALAASGGGHMCAHRLGWRAVWPDAPPSLLQGDKELAMGMAPSPGFDRATTSVAGSQISFIDFIVMPLVAPVVKIFPVRTDRTRPDSTDRTFPGQDRSPRPRSFGRLGSLAGAELPETTAMPMGFSIGAFDRLLDRGSR